jgi:hypothetical protein
MLRLVIPLGNVAEIPCDGNKLKRVGAAIPMALLHTSHELVRD